MGQYDAFGQARCTRGVRQCQRVVAIDLDFGRLPGRRFAQQFSPGNSFRHTFWRAISGNYHMLEIRQRLLVEHLLEERKEFALNDDRAGLRVLQLVANLALFVGWIHRADYYANAGCRDKRNSVLGTIGHQQANPVALAQPETIQAIGNAIDHTYNLAVGQIDVVVNNRGAVWIAIGCHTQELIVRDIRELDARTKKLWRSHFFRHTSESFLLNGECFRRFGLAYSTRALLVKHKLSGFSQQIEAEKDRRWRLLRFHYLSEGKRAARVSAERKMTSKRAMFSFGRSRSCYRIARVWAGSFPRL